VHGELRQGTEAMKRRDHQRWWSYVSLVQRDRCRTSTLPFVDDGHVIQPSRVPGHRRLQVTAFDLIEHADRLHILQHYVDFARAHVRHLDTQGRDIVDSETYGIAPDHKPQLVNVFGHLMSQWQREAQWAEKLLRQERAT
jgi:hypothetical protein